MRPRWLAILTFLLAQTPLAEEMVLQVFPLKHRTHEEILPALKPLVMPGGTVTGMNNQIIVRTTPANLIELEEVLRQIDRTPRRLKITVRQEAAGQEGGLEHGLSGAYHSSGGSHGSYRVLSTDSHVDDSQVHFVQAVEGQPAFIQTGQAVPLPGQSIAITEHGAMVQNTLQYHDITSGFDVVPTLNDDRVTLRIAPRQARLHPSGAGVIGYQAAETTVSGRLGEWMELGGMTENLNEDAHANLTQTRRYGNEHRRIWVKVEEHN